MLASVDAIEMQRRIGKRIRSCRLEAKFTQQELASSLGLTRSSVSNIEAGTQSLSLVGFLKIAQELGVSPSVLLDSINEGIEARTSGRVAGLPDRYQSWVAAVRSDDSTFEPSTGAAV